nr:hypothetical protein [Tanacetum cinerariifolium]
MMMKSSSSENEPCGSKDCKKNTDSLNSKINDLKIKLFDSNNYWYSYKLRVAQLGERLNEYKDREEKYFVKIRTLEIYRASNLEGIKILTNEVETLKEEKDVVDGKPSPTIESTSAEGQNKHSTTAENGESTDSILSKPAVKFVKAAIRPQYRAPWVPTVNRNFPPVNRKLPTGNSNVSTVCCCCSRHVNTARPKVVINRRNRVKDVQASTCWVWKSVKPNSASIILKRYDYVDCKLLTVESQIFWQWEQPSLAVGTYTASGNSLLAVGMPCAFYSQQPYNLCNMVITELDSTKKLVNKIGEMRAISSHVL